MVFHKVQVKEVSVDVLAEYLLFALAPQKIISLYFNRNSTVNSLIDALLIIENQRKESKNKTDHSFLCLELHYEQTPDLNETTGYTNKIADAINSYFDNNIYIIAVVFEDQSKCIHAAVIISDIEVTPNESSETYLPVSNVSQMLADMLPDFEITPTSITYQFFETDTPKAYDSIYHVECNVYY